MPELFGLKNCDSCHSARRWLAAQGMRVEFFDLRDAPPPAQTLNKWIDDIGWQTLLNRRSKTWRDLTAAQRDGLDRKQALALMQAYPVLIKRPVLVHEGQAHAGFSAERYSDIFGVS